jgi:hypothetical protein
MDATDVDPPTAESGSDSDLLANAREDLLVAAAATVCTIALTLGVEFGLGRSIPIPSRIVPIVAYIAYLFVRKREVSGALGDVRTWIGLVVAATAVTFVFYAV